MFRRVLKPKGIYVLIGGGGAGQRALDRTLGSPGQSADVVAVRQPEDSCMMMAELNKKDLTVLADLMQSGKVTPVIDRTYKLSQVPDALRYLEKGHARGKVVIKMD